PEASENCCPLKAFELSDSDLSEPPTDEVDDGQWTEDSAEPSAAGDVAGKRIALAGKLGGMNRREAANLLRSYLASVVDLNAEAIDWVVFGAEESPLSETQLLTAAVREAAASGALEVIAE